jgi:hypothetical protein
MPYRARDPVGAPRSRTLAELGHQIGQTALERKPSKAIRPMSMRQHRAVIRTAFRMSLERSTEPFGGELAALGERIGVTAREVGLTAGGAVAS